MKVLLSLWIFTLISSGLALKCMVCKGINGKCDNVDDPGESKDCPSSYGVNAACTFSTGGNFYFLSFLKFTRIFLSENYETVRNCESWPEERPLGCEYDGKKNPEVRIHNHFLVLF